MKAEHLKINSRIAHLISAYLTETLTEEEGRELERWRQTEANERLFKRIVSADFLENRMTQSQSVDYVAGWLAVEAAYRNHRKRILKRGAAVAAVLLLLLGTTLFFALNRSVQNTLPVVMQPGELRAELILPDGQIISLDDSKEKQTLPELLDPYLISKENDSEAKPEYTILQVPKGGEFTVTLLDGSVVSINSESKLTIPTTFSKENRTIAFEGEAYFDIVKDSSHPFKIELGHSTIEVLGTSFNVRSYPDEQEIQTTLVDGRVVFATADEELILQPGEQSVWDRKHSPIRRKVDTDMYTGWRTGIFIFNETPLKEVMKTLARWYNFEAKFLDPQLQDVTFSGEVMRYDTFDKIIEMFELTGNVKFTINGKEIEISE